MSWVRIDDTAPDHPKLVGLSEDAFALWVRGLCYCARHLTDGAIPLAAVRTLSRAKRWLEVATMLVDARLWECTVAGYQVHDYLDYHPSADEVRSRREAKQEAGRRGGIRSGESRSKEASKVEAGASGGASRLVEPNRTPDPVPIPSRPDPLIHPSDGTREGGLIDVGPAKPKPDRKKPAREMPTEWSPSAAHRSKATALGVDCDVEAIKFRDYHTSKASRFADWDAAFRTWLGNAASFTRGSRVVGLQQPAKPGEHAWKMPKENDWQKYAPHLADEAEEVTS